MPGIRHQSARLRLKDGAWVHFRPIRPGEEDTLVRIFQQLSPGSIYHRFFTGLPALRPALLKHLANLDYRRRLALVAETDTGPVAVARYEGLGEQDLAEIAIAVADEWQNRGLGRMLVRQLLRAGEGNGIRRFCAHLLAENRRILHLLATEAHICKAESEGATVTLWLTRRTDANRARAS